MQLHAPHPSWDVGACTDRVGEVKIPRLLDGRLKFRHLALVDALSRQGSVVSAAAELHLTQPAATRNLQELEDILGVPLYERGPRGVTPTVFGEAFTGHARAVLAQLAQAGRHVMELADADRGTVIVDTHLAGSNVLLPRAIAEIKKERPYLTVIVREASPEALLLELEAGRIDFRDRRRKATVTLNPNRRDQLLRTADQYEQLATDNRRELRDTRTAMREHDLTPPTLPSDLYFADQPEPKDGDEEAGL